MRQPDLAALRWIEVTIRRAGRRAAVDYNRYARELLRASADSDAPEPDFAALATEDQDMVMDLRLAFRMLPLAERQILFLSIVADWPQRRIAAAVHLSQARVSQLRRQALGHLRELLADGKENHE